MKNKELDKLYCIAKAKKKELFDYMKSIKLSSDDQFIDKLSKALNAQGDLNFKMGIEFVKFGIEDVIDKRGVVSVFNGIPFSYNESVGMTTFVQFRAYKEDMTEDEAKDIQTHCGYPVFPFGFYDFRRSSENQTAICSWNCSKKSD